jgi:hypothetical protein
MISPYQLYYDFLAEHVLTPFYSKRFDDLTKIQLTDVLKNKNPYLFKAKNIELAGDFVKGIVDARLSSQEETIFGNLLEEFAIYVSQNVDSGFKSEGLKSVDLEFSRGEIYYMVGIKSGTKWANSDQLAAMKNHFKDNREILRQRGILKQVVAVNGCMYGIDAKPLKENKDPDKVYYRYAGQDFWHFISGDENLYQEIIVPIDKEAKKKDEAFKAAYVAKVNQMTHDFTNNFMTHDNQIDWVKLVDFVSKRRLSTPLQPELFPFDE